MATTPPVSVLIPVYNTARYLPEALESIFAQTHVDFEVVAVDDGSTDGSREVLEEYAAREPRMKVLVNERNSGIVHTLNRGLEACSGTYVARMDSDDVSLPRRLEMQVAALEKDPAIAAVGGAVIYIDDAGNDLGLVRNSSTHRDPLIETPLLHPTVMIRKSALGTLRYEERFRLAEDYYLWLKLGQVGKLAALPEPVVRYRLTAGASRVRSLRKMLLRTLQVKIAAVHQLGYRPSAAAVFRFAGEAVLLLLPARLVFRLYCLRMFGRSGGCAA